MTATAATTVLATVLNRFKSLDAIRPHASLCAELCVASLDAELSKDRRRQGLKAVVGLMRIVRDSKESVASFAVEPLLEVVVAAAGDSSSTALRLDAIEALLALASHTPVKSAVEDALKQCVTNDKSPDVVRSAMRARAELTGGTVPMTA
jgi:hypothetical protein